MEIRNGIIFFDTKAEFEAYVSDTNNVSITNYPVYIGDTKEIITHNVTYKDASEIDASQITSGTISVDRLPAGSLERCVVVANESARFALTTNDVQDGDTVKQSDTGVMYMVVDVNNLNSDAGYLTYTAVTDWESIANKPEFDYVKYSEQELTDEQKQIARENIGVPTKVSELENDKNYLENGSGIIANGIYIYDTLGRFTLPENWDTSQNDLAVGVAVVHDHGAFVVAGDNNAYISKPTFGLAENVVWGSYGTDIPTLQNFETAENARSDFDGVNNTKKIVEALGENCAAYYATQFVFKNGKSGYLPSYGEAFVLSSNITEINTAFSVIGTELDRYSDTYLAVHTSTELNANECIISSFCYDFSEPNIQSKDCTSWFGDCKPTYYTDYYLGVLPFLHVEKEDLLIKTNGDGTNLLADDGEYKAIKTVNGESLLGEGNIEINSYENITYEELYALKAQGKLVPDRLYCITNFHLLPNERSGLKETTNQYDLIVTATSNDTISNRAFAKHHENDTYFSYCNLAKWQIWYDFDANSVNAQKLVINISNSLIPAASEINIPVYVLENGDKVLCDNVYMASGYHYSCPSLINQNTFYYVNQNELNIGDIVYSTDGDPIAIVDITKGYAFGPWYSSGSYKRYYYSINSIPQVGDSIAIVYFYGDEFMNVSGFNTIDDVQYSTGWIYRMIDEYENDVPYDFKTLTTYNRQKNAYYYTFGFESDVDMSLTGSCYRNIIVGTGWDSYINRGNVFGAGSFDNFVVGQRNVITGSWNRIESGDDNIINGDQNSLCTNAYNIKVTGYDNTFNPGCTEITISGNYNNIGNGCYGITFSGDHNVFNPGCTNITAGEQFTCNVIKGFTDMIEAGNNCYENVLGGVGLTLPDNFRNNTLEQVSELTVTSVNESEYVQNVTFKKEVTGSIEIPVTNQDYSLTVTKNSNGELQIYNEADLVDPDIEHLVEVTYEELFEMQCLSKLTPGVKYKLINYKFSSALSDVRSAEQGMDIVLTATSSNQLDENASVYFKMPCDVYTTFGDLKWDGRKEKCIEVYLEDANEYYLCYYGGVYSNNTQYKPPYKYRWCIVGSNNYWTSSFFSDQRFIQPGDVLYVNGGSMGFMPEVTCVSEEKLYDIYYEGSMLDPNPEIYYYGCDKKYIWNNGVKEDIYVYNIYSSYPDSKGVGVARYNLINKEFEMDADPLYYNGSLFGCLVEFSVDSETFQRMCWKIEDNSNTLFISRDGYMFGTDVTPEAPKDCLIGDKGVIWIPTHGGGMPVAEGTIIDHVFHFGKDRGYISYMKDHAENEAWYDFKNALILEPIYNNGNYSFTILPYISFNNEEAIKNKILAPLSYRNMISWGSCNLIDYSANVYLGGNGNIIKHSDHVKIIYDNNYVLNCQNIESVATNNNKFEHCKNCILDGDGNYISNSENVNVIGSNNTILDSTGVTGKADKCVFKNANLTINANNSIRECLVTKCGDDYKVKEDIQSKIFWRSNNKTFILDPADIASDSILNSTF